MGRGRRLASLYLRIARTYWAWRRSLLQGAVVVFVPLGLLDAITIHADIGSFDLGNGLELAAAIGAVAALSVTGLVGEVFFSGAVAVSLTQTEHGRAPTLREISRRLDYRRLIAVDVLYGLMVTLGLVALVVPGVLLFVWFGLSGPVVEIEGRGVRGAFARSWRLVRGHFWTVLAVLGPLEIVGDGLTGLLAHAVHGLIGDSLFGTWLAEALANIAFTPVYAVAAVLLTLDLIAARDGTAPRVAPEPSPAPA